MKSIIQTEKECFYCHRTDNLSCHHIYFGSKNRKHSDENGFTVWLCPEHHVFGRDAVHNNNAVDRDLKEYCQEVFERTHTREEFMRIIGRNYLDE